MNDIRKKILSIIKEQNITQKELANRSNISYISLNRFLTGNRSGIGMESLLCIAKGLKISPKYLLFADPVTLDEEFSALLEEISSFPPEEKKRIVSIIKSIIKIYHTK